MVAPSTPPAVIAPMPTMPCPRCWATGHEGGDQTGYQCLLCLGRQVVDDEQLAGHFWLSEVVRARSGYDQWPPVDALERLGELARHLLEPVRLRFGRPLRVTSGYRCRSLDVVADRGNTYWLEHPSAHAIGAAADVCPLQLDAGSDLSHTLARIMGIVRDTPGLEWDQAILEGGCVHLALHAPGPGRAQRRQLLLRCRAHEGPRPYRYEEWDGTEAQLTRCT